MLSIDLLWSWLILLHYIEVNLTVRNTDLYVVTWILCLQNWIKTLASILKFNRSRKIPLSEKFTVNVSRASGLEIKCADRNLGYWVRCLSWSVNSAVSTRSTVKSLVPKILASGKSYVVWELDKISFRRHLHG